MRQVLLTGMTDSTVFVLLATAFFLIYNVGKVLHFAHGTAYVIGAYAGFVAGRTLPFGAALVTAVVAGGLFGAGCEHLVYRPLRTRGATAMILLIASLAVFILGENLIGMVFGSLGIELHSPLQAATGIFGPNGLTWVQGIGLVGAIAWVAGVALVLARTPFGYYIRAMSVQLRLAELSGVPTERVRLLVFLTASAAVGFAGFIRMMDINGSPTMDLTGSLYAIVPFIVGGARSVWGTVIGALLIGFGSSWFGYQFGVQWTEAFLFALLAVIVLTRPQGLISLGSR